MTPDALRDAADWLGARLKAAPRPAKVAAPALVAALPLFVPIPAVTPAKPAVEAESKRGGASNAC